MLNIIISSALWLKVSDNIPSVKLCGNIRLKLHAIIACIVFLGSGPIDKKKQ